jgi:hypothetical protein
MAEPIPGTSLGTTTEFAHRTWPANARQLAAIRAEVRGWPAPLVLAADVEDHGTWRRPSGTVTSRGHGITIMRRLMTTAVIHYDGRGTRVFRRRALPDDGSARAAGVTEVGRTIPPP